MHEPCARPWPGRRTAGRARPASRARGGAGPPLSASSMHLGSVAITEGSAHLARAPPRRGDARPPDRALREARVPVELGPVADAWQQPRVRLSDSCVLAARVSGHQGHGLAEAVAAPGVRELHRVVARHGELLLDGVRLVPELGERRASLARGGAVIVAGNDSNGSKITV